MNKEVATFENRFSESINALKGILIIVVVMDHNDLLRAFASDLFKPLTFHVLGFLILPFLVGTRTVATWGFIRDRLVRYMVPFWAVFSLASVVYAVAYRGADGLAAIAFDWLAASLVGSALLVKASSGFYYLWFLPSLAGVIIALATYNALEPRWRIACTVMSVTAHLAISIFSVAAITYVPFGFLIVLWVFPIGLLFRFLMKSPRIFQLRWLVLATCIACYGYLVLHRQNIEIMTLDLRPINEITVFLMQDISAVFGVLVAIWIASKLRQSWFLNKCGQYSLLVYLFHPLIFFAGYKLSGAESWGLQGYELLVVGVISVAITVFISVIVAAGISSSTYVRSWMMPKGWGDWAPVRAMAQQKRALHDKRY